MRSTCWMGVAALVVVAGGLRVADCVAAGKQRRQAAAPVRRAPQPAASAVVEGLGRTPADARMVAQENARQKVAELLKERFAGSDWTVPEERLEPAYLAAQGVITPEGEPELDGRFEDKTLVARYRVELTPAYLKELSHLALQDRVQERHLLVVRILAGLLSVLLVTAGYLRLEEMTRGYATKLLRLGVALVLSLVGFVLWLTW